MKAIKWLLLCVACVLVLLLLSAFLLKQSAALITTHDFLQHPMELYVFRYLIITIIVIGWPYWIRLLSRYRSWDFEITEILIRKRWYLILFFAVVELLI
jgi:hypothetical protein